MKLSRSFGMAAGLLVLATPFWSMAEPPMSPTGQQTVLQMFPNSGNSAAQGRFYDGSDEWVDPRSGLPLPGSPAYKEGSGGGSGGGD